MVGSKVLWEGVDRGPSGIECPQWKLTSNGVFSVKSTYEVACKYEQPRDYGEWLAVWQEKGPQSLNHLYGSFGSKD